MAVDKLVDGAKLDACLDAEADAIRAKTGGSADIPFDFANNKGFADAIAAIPSGGGSGLPSGWNIIMDERITLVSNNWNLPFPRTITVPTFYVLVWYAPELTTEVEYETLASGYRLQLRPTGAWGNSATIKNDGTTGSSGWTNLRTTNIGTDSNRSFGAGVEYRVILVEVTS